MYVVDLVLRDNKGTLNNGVIFYRNVVGEESIQDRDEMLEVLNGIDNGKYDGRFGFQNSCINTVITSAVMESYNIREINDKEW